MPKLINRQIVLAAYPEGAPKDSDFELVESPVPEPRVGQVLCRAIYLSLDPYMRGRISPAKSYAKGVGIGEGCCQVKANGSPKPWGPRGQAAS